MGFVSTSPTKNFNNSSTTTSSFLSKKNTSVKASSGLSLISVWTWLHVLSFLKNLWEFSPFSKKNQLCQKLLMTLLETNFTQLTKRNLQHSLNQRSLKKGVLTSSYLTTLVMSDTMLMDGFSRTKIL